MARITGRPKKAIRQEKNIGFFVTRAQYEVIEKKVKEAGVNISDYMRQVAVFGTVVARWRKADRLLFKKLVGMSNDLNQLVQIARQEGALHSMLYFERYRGKIDAAIKRMGRDPRDGADKVEGGDRVKAGKKGRGADSDERRAGKEVDRGAGGDRDMTGEPRRDSDGTKAGKEGAGV